MSIEKKETASAHFEVIRDDLFREAVKLISKVPSVKIAIIITPPAGSGLDISTYSFGHPSAEGVFKNLLEDKGKGKAPMEDEDDEEEKELWSPKGWWNDAKKIQSMNSQQLKAAIDQLTKL